MEAVSQSGPPPEENSPTDLPLRLDVVRGRERLPADQEFGEMLKKKLRLLQSDSTEVNSLFTDLSAHVISINSEQNTIFLRFRTFEEIWKFNTYYTTGILAQCMDTLFLDEKCWLSSLEENVAMAVSIQEETLHGVYRGILMQEGSFFAVCGANQTFDSSTSGRDLHLEQGDIAQFEPPFLGSGWTVHCLTDGARGTAPKLSLEPVAPFHQWFLKSCSESILVGKGKPACELPLQFARGRCVATAEYLAEGPDELSVAPGDCVTILGILVPCFDWFTGRNQTTGEEGLVQTSMVTPTSDTYDSTDECEEEEEEEEEMFDGLQEDTVIDEVMDLLKRSENHTGQNYKLDVAGRQDSENKTAFISPNPTDPQLNELRRNVLRILHHGEESSSASESSSESVGKDAVELMEAKRPPGFTVDPSTEVNNSEKFIPLFSFLEGREPKAEFNALYRLSSELLTSTTFSGHSDDEELMGFLGAAREAARRKRLYWPQTRLCFLLGRLSAGRTKFSQARVYFEEALGVPQEAFRDLKLLASIYSNLASIYHLQKNAESFFSTTERLAALLLGSPAYLDSLVDDLVLKYILKKAIVSQNQAAEAWACYLLARHHWRDGAEKVAVVPYLERLLVLPTEAQRLCKVSLCNGYLTLARLYDKLRLLHLSVSSAKTASRQPSSKLRDCLHSLILVLTNVNKLNGVAEQQIPPQIAPLLGHALSFTSAGPNQHPALSYHLTVCLCQLFYKQNMVGRAVHQMHLLINNCPSPFPVSVLERNSALVWLSWLHIENSQPHFALEILDAVLSSLPEHCTSPQEGVVHNMRGVALRCLGDIQRATESYQAAADICQEFEDQANLAVTQANLGLLCLGAGAKGLAQRHLVEAVQLFSGLDGDAHVGNFIAVLLELGHLYLLSQQFDHGTGCYEWALLLAINANRLDCQLAATGRLCHVYGGKSLEQSQLIIYSEYRVRLLRLSGDRGQEGEALEAIIQLYLGLGTQRAYQSALEYTKSSLGISIDLGCRQKEAHGWLQAGKIYHLLGQTELVDLYVQAAQDVAVKTGDSGFVLQLLEAAGDIFFNSCESREKCITFYRDLALPIAVTNNSSQIRLRLCNKLTQVMLSLKLFQEAVEFAQAALDISVTLGERLNERVASHRLASLYHSLQQYELAEHFYLKTLSHCPTPLQFEEETLFYLKVYQTLGDIIFYDLKDPFDAAGYYHLALAAAMDLGNKRAQLHLCTHLATIYHNFLMDRELSLFFYQRARGFAAELNVKRVDISSDKHFGNLSESRVRAEDNGRKKSGH